MEKKKYNTVQNQADFIDIVVMIFRMKTVQIQGRDMTRNDQRS